MALDPRFPGARKRANSLPPYCLARRLEPALCCTALQLENRAEHRTDALAECDRLGVDPGLALPLEGHGTHHATGTAQWERPGRDTVLASDQGLVGHRNARSRILGLRIGNERVLVGGFVHRRLDITNQTGAGVEARCVREPQDLHPSAAHRTNAHAVATQAHRKVGRHACGGRAKALLLQGSRDYFESRHQARATARAPDRTFQPSGTGLEMVARALAGLLG